MIEYALLAAKQDIALEDAHNQITSLREALKPFADLLQSFDKRVNPDGSPHYPDSKPLWDREGAIITLGDVRRAARELESSKERS